MNKKGGYLPSNVKTAAPRARMPISMGKNDIGKNEDIPKNRKNKRVHQPAIVLGMFIFYFSLIL